jgi:hypothetical protein
MICMIYVRPEKTKFPYFPGYVFRTSLLYVLVLSDGVFRTFQWNNGNFIIQCYFGSIVTILYFPPLLCCTSLYCHVVLLSITVLYFPLLSCYIFHRDFFLMQNYKGPYTSLNWVFVLFVPTIVYFRSLQYCTFCYKSYFYTYLWETVCIPLD